MNKKVEAPWFKYYGNVAHTISYPEATMVELVEKAAKKYPDYIAYDFMGNKTRYKDMIDKIHLCARAFKAIGIKEDDRVTICLPNVPQAVICFYALNMIGAIANMIHPLSSEGEIEFFLKDSNSVAAITLDQFYGKFASIRKRVKLNHLIISSVKDALGSVLKVGYQLREGRKIPKIPANANVIMWKNFLAIGQNYLGKYRVKRTAKSPAVVLYSGGTTGVSKGILLSNLNFNALALQTAEMAQCCVAGHSMLAVMPIFHGFGLGICIHMVLVKGCKCILIPRFNAASYAMLLKKKRPNYIAGVPTLYEAIIRNPDMNGVDLSCLEGVFSGGDSLSVELKKKFDAFLKNHNAKVRVREGYGLTECVTASCLTPKDFEREGSIGLPFPDTFYKIVKFQTNETVPYGEEGEICISGPSVMLGYVNHPEETAQTLKIHDDGRVWLHTGDLGKMDADGFVYYRQRIKRMIISSGYNIYPGQLENAIDEHDKVLLSCVIGVPDSYKGQKVKAFVVLRDGVEPNEKVRLELIEHCKKKIARYAMPYDIEFRTELPKTLVGKVNFKVLEEEELQKMGMGK